jgi:hypothetical protein
MVMKEIYTCFVFTVCFLYFAQAQPKPELLKEPSGWLFEHFALPPAFAPGVKYKGIEELRFSPGMFKKDTAGYFTYAFAARLDSVQSISSNEIRDYLLTYFKGLCSSTAKDRKMTIDTSKITVLIAKKAVPGTDIIYDALLNVFGVFADGAPVKLNMEVKVLEDAAHKKVYLMFIASPQPRTDDMWRMLYKLQKSFTIPAE